MRTVRHILEHPPSGTTRQLTAWHFGTSGARPKAYLQAGLHADEWPPMLVAHHLCQQIKTLEESGAARGEIVLVPMANPIGLGQLLHGHAFGRFNFRDGKNFNRDYPSLGRHAGDLLQTSLGPDAMRNVMLARTALLQALAEQPVANELQAVQNWLMRQACDADIVLDLHCDTEALLHVYTGIHHPRHGIELARLTGAHALLTSEQSGDDPFDEAVVHPWVELAARFAPQHPIPPACFAATVEFRGQADVGHELARQDATHLLQFLVLHEVLGLPDFDMPAALCDPTPLSGVEPVLAPASGVLVFRAHLGQRVAANEVLLELIDPLSGQCLEVRAQHSGLLFVRTRNHFVAPGAPLAKIAGSTPFRRGKLLGL